MVGTNLDRRRMLAALASIITISAVPVAASISGASSKAATEEELMKEIMRVFMGLSRPMKEQFLTYLTWQVEDGRPETDPRRDDPAWAEFDRRRTIGA